MSASFFVSKIIQQTQVTNTIFCMTVKCDLPLKPGQFFMVRGWDGFPLLSRPISIYDAGPNTVSFLYEVRGEGTKLLSKLQPGETVELNGPLGNGFEPAKMKGKVAVVTGGIGFAPMVYTVKQLEDCRVDFFCGFREQSYELEKVVPYVENIQVATDSGIEGHKGFITDLIKVKNYDVVLACGPEVMMKKLAKMCTEQQVPCYVSLERHMACGVGACLGCTCKTVKGAKCICKDGPVFLGEELNWDA